jgi:hypothetical protein
MGIIMWWIFYQMYEEIIWLRTCSKVQAYTDRTGPQGTRLVDRIVLGTHDHRCNFLQPA